MAIGHRENERRSVAAYLIPISTVSPIFIPFYRYSVAGWRWSKWCTYNFFFVFSFWGRSSHTKFDRLRGRDRRRVFFSGNFDSPDVRPPLRDESSVPSRAQCVLALLVNWWVAPDFSWPFGAVDIGVFASGVSCKLLRLLYLKKKLIALNCTIKFHSINNSPNMKQWTLRLKTVFAINHNTIAWRIGAGRFRMLNTRIFHIQFW